MVPPIKDDLAITPAQEHIEGTQIVVSQMASRLSIMGTELFFRRGVRVESILVLLEGLHMGKKQSQTQPL